MKLAFKALVPLLAAAALATACNPFAPDSSRSAGSQDPRFAPFTVSSENEPVYGNDTDYLNHRMPNLGHRKATMHRFWLPTQHGCPYRRQSSGSPGSQ